MPQTIISVSHRETGELLAEGPRGWGITPFEGNLYIRKQYLRSEGFKVSLIPGICFYKGLYQWYHFKTADREDHLLAWRYWLPNPLFPFIWGRIGLSRNHPLLVVTEAAEDSPAASGLAQTPQAPL